MIDLQTKNVNYVPGIDGLRAIAVLSVMLFHLDPVFLPGGFSGVDVFFVISGYVVTGSLSCYDTQKFSTFIIDFYRRRIIRIFPALLTVLLFSCFVTVFFLPQIYLSHSFSDTGLAAFFGLSNLALIHSPDSYFSTNFKFNPFVHTWSLSVEEQFYVLFPVMFFIWSRRLISRSKSLLFNLVTLSAVTSFALSWYASTYYPNHAYYHLGSRFWELATGALLFKYHSLTLNEQTNYSKIKWVFYFGILLMGLGFIFADKSSFPFPWAIPSVIGTALVIHALVVKGNLSLNLGSWLEISVIRYVGKLSYSLYLWHWPIFVFYRWTIGLQSWQEYLSAVCLTFLLAVMSFHFVERKFSSLKFLKKARSVVIVVVGISIISLSFGSSWFMFKEKNSLSFSVTADKDLWNPYEYNNDEKVGNKYDGITLFIIGDSHARAYNSMFKILRKDTGIKVKIYSRAGCGLLNLQTPVLTKSSKCKQRLTKWLTEVETEMKGRDILFLSSLKMPRMSDQNSTYPIEIETILNKSTTKKVMSSRKEALEESISVLQRLSLFTRNIIIDAPKPVFPYQASRCADWYTKSNPICAKGPFNQRKNVDALKELASDQIESIKSEFPNIRWWHTINDLCDDERCNMYNEGKPLYYDGDHLSGYGNEFLYPSFASFIAETIER